MWKVFNFTDSTKCPIFALWHSTLQYCSFMFSNITIEASCMLRMFIESQISLT